MSSFLGILIQFFLHVLEESLTCDSTPKPPSSDKNKGIKPILEKNRFEKPIFQCFSMEALLCGTLLACASLCALWECALSRIGSGFYILGYFFSHSGQISLIFDLFERTMNQRKLLKISRRSEANKTIKIPFRK